MKIPISKRNVLILAVCLSDIVSCHYQTFGDNVALHKPANQSSTYEEDRFMFNASLGVDGNKSTNFYLDKTCSHTNAKEKSAWWTVDLKGFYFIKVIRIYQHGYFNRLDGSKMYVQVEDSTWQNIPFISNWPPEMFDVNVTLNTRISSIKLNNTELLSTTQETFISICELEAYEVLACSPYIVRNGRVRVVKLGDSKQNFTYGTELTVACEKGYQLFEHRTSLNVADSIIECMGTKTWSRNLTCSAIDCGHPMGLSDNSEVTFIPGIAGNTTYNATMTIHCNEGYNYSLQSVEPLRCGGNGFWRGSIGNCNDIDECSQAGICHYHGPCSNIDGSFVCNCSAGYKGTTCENALPEINADQEQSKTCLLGWIIAGPLCLILLVTNIVTCLRLRRHENSDMETRKNKSNGPENNAMEPYDNLQMQTRSKSEYDKLTFEGESSLKTT